MKKGRERTNNNKRYLRNSRFSKFDPEGSCGPTWPEVVPLALSSLWLYYCIKKIVNINGKIPLHWLSASLDTYKVKCKKLFLENEQKTSSIKNYINHKMTMALPAKFILSK